MRKLSLFFSTMCISMGTTFMNAFSPTRETVSLEEFNLSIPEIDCIANDAIRKFNVPGASISIVINDQVILSRGYGFRNLDKQLPVTEHTLFPIASCTKAFTALILGQLVEEGKVALDDPVHKYIPELDLVDQERTNRLTIRDLLAHRTGVARHDPIWIFTEISRSSVIGLLKHLKPACDLRQEYQYNNFMYSLAGIIIERLTGQPWEGAVSCRLLKPLEMKHSITSVRDLQSSSDFSLPHAEIGGVVMSLPFRNTVPVNPALGIISNARDMANWLKLQLGQATCPTISVIQNQTLEESHKIQMPFPSSSNETEKSYYLGYGLGWLIGKYRDYTLVTHDGCIDGFFSEVAFLPEKGIGIVILTNSSSDGQLAIAAIKNQIFDNILQISDTNWVEKSQEIHMKTKHTIHNALESLKYPSQNPTAQTLEAYIGQYAHPAYGNVELKIENNKLFFIYGQTKNPLYYKSEDTFSSQSAELLVYGINPIIDLKFCKDSSATVYKVEVPFEGFRSAKPITFIREVK